MLFFIKTFPLSVVFVGVVVNFSLFYLLPRAIGPISRFAQIIPRPREFKFVQTKSQELLKRGDNYAVMTIYLHFSNFSSHIQLGR